MPLLPTRLSKAPRRWAPAALALLIALTAACARVPRERKLPYHIRSVYVPMVRNLTSEIGIEEDLTRLVVEHFLRDGRLRVAREREADLVIEIKLDKWTVKPTAFEDDEFPSETEILMEVDMTAYDPYDYDRQFPLGKWKGVTAEKVYMSNPRRMLLDVDVDAKHSALDRMANEIVSTIITVEPDDLEEIEERHLEERELGEAQERQVEFRAAYLTSEKYGDGKKKSAKKAKD